MVIRPARAEDFPTIAAITNHYITTTPIHFAYEPITDAELFAQWEQRGKHAWVIAEDAPPELRGPVIGYAKSCPWRDRAAYAWTAEVGLYIAHDQRGRGLGTALYTELFTVLAQRGFRSAVAGITLPNDPSIALHEKLGFTRVGTFEDAGYKMGAWHAVEWWQKRFATGPEAPPDAPTH